MYLHHVLDIWFEKRVKPNLKGEALLVRYADDFVCAFRYREDAERFYRTLPKRLGKFGLELSPEKTRLIRFSRFHPGGKRRICFLGFELNWGHDRQRRPRLHRRTAKKEVGAGGQRDGGVD
ncbi:MAG: reverse transcriptase domain-containing protein [Candidatus Sedimenticola sp. (ex Thyasira tokunagai)]